MCRFKLSEDEVSSIDINQEGKLMATGDDNGEAILIDLSTNDQSSSIHAHESLCTSVIFSPYAENELFTAGMDCCVKSWDIETGDAFWTDSLSDTRDLGMVNPPMVFDMDVPTESDWDGLLVAAVGDGSIYVRIEESEGHSTSGWIACQRLPRCCSCFSQIGWHCPGTSIGCILCLLHEDQQWSKDSVGWRRSKIDRLGLDC